MNCLAVKSLSRLLKIPSDCQTCACADMQTDSEKNIDGSKGKIMELLESEVVLPSEVVYVATTGFVF